MSKLEFTTFLQLKEPQFIESTDSPAPESSRMFKQNLAIYKALQSDLRLP